MGPNEERLLTYFLEHTTVSVGTHVSAVQLRTTIHQAATARCEGAIQSVLIATKGDREQAAEMLLRQIEAGRLL